MFFHFPPWFKCCFSSLIPLPGCLELDNRRSLFSPHFDGMANKAFDTVIFFNGVVNVAVFNGCVVILLFSCWCLLLPFWYLGSFVPPFLFVVLGLFFPYFINVLCCPLSHAKYLFSIFLLFLSKGQELLLHFWITVSVAASPVPSASCCVVPGSSPDLAAVAS